QKEPTHGLLVQKTKHPYPLPIRRWHYASQRARVSPVSAEFPRAGKSMPFDYVVRIRWERRHSPCSALGAGQDFHYPARPSSAAGPSSICKRRLPAPSGTANAPTTAVGSCSSCTRHDGQSSPGGGVTQASGGAANVAGGGPLKPVPKAFSRASLRVHNRSMACSRAAGGSSCMSIASRGVQMVDTRSFNARNGGERS